MHLPHHHVKNFHCYLLHDELLPLMSYFLKPFLVLLPIVVMLLSHLLDPLISLTMSLNFLILIELLLHDLLILLIKLLKFLILVEFLIPTLTPFHYYHHLIESFHQLLQRLQWKHFIPLLIMSNRQISILYLSNHS